MLILHGPGSQPPRRLTQALQKWLDCAEETGTYFTYELCCEKAPQQADEAAVAALLDAVMDQAMELCGQLPPQERWLSLLCDYAPERLRIECTGPGTVQLVREKGGVPMEFIQNDGDFHLRLKMDMETAV